MKFSIPEVLQQMTRQIHIGVGWVEILGRNFKLQASPGGVISLIVPLQGGSRMVFETVSPNERSLSGQAVKNFGHLVIRIKVDNNLKIDGSIDGTYVGDVDLECSRLVLEETNAN